MQWDIIKLAHEQGHFGSAKTMIMLKRDYWFPNMEDKVKKVINNCIRCMLAEKKKGKGERVLYPIEKRAVPLDTYHIDHLGPMPSTKKSYNYIFIIVDVFTKFTWLYPTKTTTTKELVGKLKLQTLTFGNPTAVQRSLRTYLKSIAKKKKLNTY